MQQKELISTVENSQTHEVLGRFIKKLPDQDAGQTNLGFKTINFYFKNEIQAQACRVYEQ